ncbi:hypothetical protein HW555_010066, partial [Spodoptera exigua]
VGSFDIISAVDCNTWLICYIVFCGRYHKSVELVVVKLNSARILNEFLFDLYWVCRSKSRRYLPGHKKTTLIYNIIKMQNNQEDEEEVWSTEIDYVALSPPPTPQPPPAWLRRSSSIAYVCFMPHCHEYSYHPTRAC